MVAAVGSLARITSQFSSILLRSQLMYQSKYSGSLPFIRIGCYESHLAERKTPRFKRERLENDGYLVAASLSPHHPFFRPAGSTRMFDNLAFDLATAVPTAVTVFDGRTHPESRPTIKTFLLLRSIVWVEAKHDR